MQNWHLLKAKIQVASKTIRMPNALCSIQMVNITLQLMLMSLDHGERKANISKTIILSDLRQLDGDAMVQWWCPEQVWQDCCLG